MATRKPTAEQIAATQEKIGQYENRLKALSQKRKEQERKERTRRLIERGAILESLIDGAASFTNEQIKALLTAALHTNIALDKLLSLRERDATETPRSGGMDTAQNVESGAGWLTRPPLPEKGALIYHIRGIRAPCRGRFCPIGQKVMAAMPLGKGKMLSQSSTTALRTRIQNMQQNRTKKTLYNRVMKNEI